MEPEGAPIEENIRLEVPRPIRVYEIDDPSYNNNSKCWVILIFWVILILSLIILKTLF